MAFWLTRSTGAQETTSMQRFDPRFWTVNFPRPAMASVITTAPDALKVDLELHHAGEIVGLIWESADTLDHPLLAYATDRDYRNTTLSFRWQSTGVIPLDQANGPTLTIEGRDAAGQPRTWYVRLWRYAVGTPVDAQVTLPFSTLRSGFGSAGEPIFAGDIDRMFISLVAPGFVAGSTAALAQRFNGSLTLSGIRAEGARAMVPLGDVLVPPNGERMATAYDDAYNQTPARLLRAITGLGYREEIVHYVGMSHFMRLARDAEQILRADPTGALCTPASVWHSTLFTQAKTAGFSVIVSLSYELFDSYCPEAWKQRTASGAPALTGWVPPSVVLSPAHIAVRAWQAGAARAFVALLKAAAQPVRFQIGEPWWWVTADREICLYDAASKAALGGNPLVIPDLAAPLNSGARGLLNIAGALLAQSTALLRNAVRSAAAGPSEVMLLAFTPTILAPNMPDLYLANLPLGWAYPNYDRLQLEDYDWLTAGAGALRRSAYSFVNTRLGYPLAAQDYLSGFVLDPADAETFWARIDARLDEAATRGIARRYVWALPQVSRDGYTRLSPALEEAMDPFDDVLYPFALGRSASVAPEFSTSIAVTASGHERRNSLWSDARLHFDVGPGIRSEAELADLIAFFRARRGPARGFRLTDPFDNSTNGMTSTPTRLDQLLGLGDGAKADFQLVKLYGGGTEPQVRAITRPRADTLVVSVGGVATTAFTLGAKGMLRLTTAPTAGAEVRAGFRFDVPVRFAEDRLDVSAVNFTAGEAPSVPLIEIRESA
ncbi:MAG: DUF2460 domain-containing protein [Erythrobacter sp.]